MWVWLPFLLMMKQWEGKLRFQLIDNNNNHTHIVALVYVTCSPYSVTSKQAEVKCNEKSLIIALELQLQDTEGDEEIM